MDREQAEKLVKSAVTEAAQKAAGEVPTLVESRLAGPVMQHVINETWAETLAKEAANGGAQDAILRTGLAVTGKGAARLDPIGKMAGSAADALVSPLLELGQVAYEDYFKGEERTSQDYKDAVKRGAAEAAEDLIGDVKKAASEKVAAEAASRLAGPVMQHVINKTWAETLAKEAANGGAQDAILRTGLAVTGKGAARLDLIAGPLAGVIINPVFEVGQVAYQHHVRGEERTSKDYKDAVTRGAASGIAGVLATACTAAAVGSVVPGAGTVAGFIVGMVASGYVSKRMT